MGDVINMADHRPHITVETPDGNVHVLPQSLLDDIIEGKRTVDDIEGRDQVMRGLLMALCAFLYGED